MVVALCIFNLSYPYLMKIRFNKCYKDDTFSTELSSKFNCHITTYIYNGKSLKDCNALVCGFIYSVIFFFYISRKQEFEADKFAIDNGADTEAFSKALDKLADLNLFAKKRNFIEEILSTHPSTIKRITRLKDYHP